MTRVLALLVLVVISAAGCGGGEQPADQGSVKPDKAVEVDGAPPDRGPLRQDGKLPDGPDAAPDAADLALDMTPDITPDVTPDMPACGNLFIDPGEKCDGALLKSATCKTEGFDGGTLACAKDCKFYDTSKCFKCGDGKVNGSESCDGSDLNNTTCKDASGFDGGTLACNAKCLFDTAKCYKCGDGKITAPEKCDGALLDNKTCKDLAYAGGTLKCAKDCLTLDHSGCNYCGNGKLDGKEKCDGAALNGETCKSMNFFQGTLRCDSKCAYDTSGCKNAGCGNNKIDAGEDCDATLLGGQTCKGLGQDGGTLKCTAGCKHDLAGCYKCGDKKKNGAEQCDGADLDTQSCLTLNFDGGTLKCTAGCALDKSGCYKCGDSTKNGAEQCDAADLGGATCKSQFFFGGTISCSGTCKLDTSKCHNCGDAKVDSGEQCDGANLNKQDCKSLNFFKGTLKCGDCKFDTSGCTNVGCNNGKLDSGEKCDGKLLGGQTCKLQGFDAGTLACTGNCVFDTAKCYKCGDNKTNPGETCDGPDLNSKTCKLLSFDGGTLKCKAGCGGYDTAGCYRCGDKTKNGNEKCDDKDFGATTCTSLKFDGGKLGCTAACLLDTTGCHKCGDNKLGGAEKCDGTALNSKACKDFPPFHSGALKCKAGCAAFDTSGCNKCGDKIKNGPDACDGADFGSASCKTLKFDGGKLGCSAACKVDTSKCYKCGDGKVGGPELCDGVALDGQSCTLLGWDGGTLKCKAGCAAFDTSGCYKCGDKVKNGAEQCDGADNGSATCKTLKFDGGTLACSPACKLETSKCYTCGDNKLGGPEVCDGTALNSKTCKLLNFDGGTLGCKAGCAAFDTSKCYKCGDNKLGGAEVCDGTALNAKTCKLLNFDGGTLGCKAGCAAFETSKCYKCGDKDKNGSEKCDDKDFGSTTCASEQFDGGTLGCTSTCTLITSGCYKCGDNKLGGSEICDGTALNGKTCVSIPPYHSGQLKCAAGCNAFDTSSCNKCGDNKLNGTEKCDGNDLGISSCVTLNFDGGTLKCAAGCATFDTSGCYKCGDNKLNGSEECDGTAIGSKTCADYGYLGGTLKCSNACKHDKNSCVNFKWVTVKAGTFSMGSPGAEACRQSDEKQHSVTLTNDFEIANVEVTQGQYKTLMGASPSKFSSCGAGCPVEQVTWHDAAAYANKLSASKVLMPCYLCVVDSGKNACRVNPEFSGKKIYDCPGYRLPTEAEWEYAYRAGTTTGLYNGTISGCTSDTNAGLIGWYKANAATKSHVVAGKAANAWGLYDMAGNVWEWCHDWYQADLGSSAATDPTGAATDTRRVFRGGAWSDTSLHLRAAVRNKDLPTYVSNIYGFRPVRTLNSPLVAWWKLDEGSGAQAKDATGNGHHGAVKGSPAWGAGKLGKALVFDGVDDRFELSEPYAVDSGAISITGWIKTLGTSQVALLVSNGYTSAVNHFELGVDADGLFHLSRDISGSGSTLKSVVKVATGRWVHVAWTRTAAGLDTLYVDGVASASKTVAGDLSDSKTWSIGCLQSAGTNCFRGAADDLRLYRRALTAAQVKAQYSTSSFCDDRQKNGAETDVDCGGSNCKKCMANQKCSGASDCASGVCTSGLCASGCTHQAVTKSCTKDSLGISWCAVPAGCYKMGSPSSDPCRDASNEDLHQVTLTNRFEAASTETTQGQFKALTTRNPSHFGPNGSGTPCGNDCPVETVFWDEAAWYCNALSAKKGLTQCYHCTGGVNNPACKLKSQYSSAKAVFNCSGYRLPTDTEWEYAYRAGTTTQLHSGNITAQCGDYVDANTDLIAWYYRNANNKTHPVAKRAANAWGLHDMSGNVWEWCEDGYVAKLNNAAEVDPVAPDKSTRVARGGSIGNSPDHMRAATRRAVSQGMQKVSYGFRCIRTLSPDNRCVVDVFDFVTNNQRGFETYSWGVHTGNVKWTAASEVVTYTGGSSSGGGNSVHVIGESDWTDYAVEADVKPVSVTTSGNWLGVVGRYQSTSKFYALYLAGTGSVHLIYGSTTLAQKTFVVSTGTTYKLKLALNGTSIKGYVDGALVLQATHSGSTKGRSGFIAASGVTTYDNLKVTRCADQCPSTLHDFTSASFSAFSAVRWDPSGAYSWTPASGGIKYNGGDNQGSGTSLALTGNAAWTDYTVEADVTPVSVNRSPSWNGIAGRYQSNAKVYSLFLTSDGKLQLYYGLSTIAHANTTVALGTTYRLRLVFEGTKIRGYVNDRLLVQATHTGSTSGKAGFMCGGGVTQLDNLKISQCALNTAQ